MGSTYRPQSPDLSSVTPHSPDLSGYRPQSPDLSGLGAPNSFATGAFNPMQSQQRNRLQGTNGFSNYGGALPTSMPVFQPQPHQQYQHDAFGAPFKTEPDEEFMPDVRMAPRAVGRPRKNPHAQQQQQQQYMAPEPQSDPTLGVTLRTSFPVARIKRIMQADEDIGKVAQVTPHVVSRALELFMIKLISASADQARGVKTEGPNSANKGPRKVQAQHMKMAILADDNFDFLADIVKKVPDAPTAKAKKDAGSDSEDIAVPKRKAGGGTRRKRMDSGDDF